MLSIRCSFFPPIRSRHDAARHGRLFLSVLKKVRRAKRCGSYVRRAGRLGNEGTPLPSVKAMKVLSWILWLQFARGFGSNQANRHMDFFSHPMTRKKGLPKNLQFSMGEKGADQLTGIVYVCCTSHTILPIRFILNCGWASHIHINSFTRLAEASAHLAMQCTPYLSWSSPANAWSAPPSGSTTFSE